MSHSSWWTGIGTIAIYLLSFALLPAQTCDHVLTGKVLESATGEPLPYANILIKGTNKGAVADEHGHFHIDDLCPGDYVVVCTHVSCEHLEQEITINLHREELTVALTDRGQDLAAVEVLETKIAAPTANEFSVAAEQLGTNRQLGLADALEQLPGVRVFRTGGNIAKPVLQGLRGNRVLLFDRGVQLSGQQWGDDHAPELDAQGFARARVVRGAAGVRYGAGALGGVILLEPEPLPQSPQLQGALNLTGQSNGRGGGVAAEIGAGARRSLPISFRLRGSLQRLGDLQTPDYILQNTGRLEHHHSLDLGYERNGWDLRAHYRGLVNRIGIPAATHIGNLTDLNRAIERGRPYDTGSFSYELGRPQQRVFHSTGGLRAAFQNETGDRYYLNLSRQFNRRQEFDAHRNFGDLPNDFTVAQMELELTSYQLETGWEIRPLGNWYGEVGVQADWQRNTTDAGALLPDFSQFGGGLFLIERWRKPNVPWSVEAGLRYDVRALRTDERADRDFGNWTGKLSLAYQPATTLRLRLNAATAFRPPHPSELYSDGLHHGSASYEVGSPDLNAERARQLSLGLEWQPAPAWQLSLNAYAQWIDDFIFIDPLPDPVLTIRGAFPAFQYRGTDARLLGGDAQLTWTPSPDWTWSASYQVVRGYDRTDDIPLIYMPADQWRSELRYQFGPEEGSTRPFLQVGLRHTTEQTRAPLDRDFAPPPPAFTLVDLSAGGTLYWGTQPLHLSLGVRNVFNVAYRDYLDRFRYFADSPGRNVLVSLRLPIGPQ